MSKQDNPVKDFGFYAAVPRVVRTGYKEITPIQKWLYTCLKDLCGDSGTCYRSLRVLAEETGISTGMLSESVPTLHNAGLIHAEKKKRSTGGKEVWHITIVDIWGANAKAHPTKRSHCEQTLSTNDINVHIVNEECSQHEQERSQCEPARSSKGASQASSDRQNDVVRKNNEEKTSEGKKESVPPTRAQPVAPPTNAHSSLSFREEENQSVEANKKVSLLSPEVQAWFEKVYCQADHITVIPELDKTLAGHMVTLYSFKDKKGVLLLDTVHKLNSYYAFMVKKMASWDDSSVKPGNLAKGKYINEWYPTYKPPVEKKTPIAVPYLMNEGGEHLSIAERDRLREEALKAKRKADHDAYYAKLHQPVKLYVS